MRNLDQFKQIRGNPTEVAVTVKKRQRRECFIDDDTDHRMLCQPAFFAVTERQFVIGEQNVTAGTPAFGDIFPFTGGDRHEHRIDDSKQLRIVLAYRKAEAMGFVLAEVGHADVVQVALVDHVVSGNGVAEKYVRLIEGNGVDRILVGRVRRDDGLRIQGLDLFQRQIVIHRAQPQPGQTLVQGSGFPSRVTRTG